MCLKSSLACRTISTQVFKNKAVQATIGSHTIFRSPAFACRCLFGIFSVSFGLAEASIQILSEVDSMVEEDFEVLQSDEQTALGLARVPRLALEGQLQPGVEWIELAVT